MMTLEEQIADINAWQDQTFPHATAQSKAAHLLREARELYEEPTSQEEIADVFILLAGVAHKNGYDLNRIVWEKMLVNKQRQWQDPDHEGVVEHVK